MLRMQTMKTLFFLILLTVGSFLVGPAYAEYVPKIDCGIPDPGKKFAVLGYLRYTTGYGISNTHKSFNFDSSGNPTTVDKELCVPMNESDTEISFSDLLNKSIPTNNFDSIFKSDSSAIKPCANGAYDPNSIKYKMTKANCSANTYEGYYFSKNGTGSVEHAKVAFIKFWTIQDICAIKNQSDCGKAPSCAWFAGSCMDKANVTKGGISVADCSGVLKNITCGPETCKEQCQKFTNCAFVSNECKNKENVTPEEKQKALTDAVNKANTEKYKPPAESNFLPNCAYPGTCDDINDLLLVLINIAKFLFKIIGTAAFVFFVYGGFMMIISMGNQDRVKKGRETMVAAVIGIIIAFSAYTLVDLVLDVFQVTNEFRAVGNLNLEKPKK